MKDAPALGRAAQKWGIAILRHNESDDRIAFKGAWRMDKKYVADAIAQRLGFRDENTIRES